MIAIGSPKREQSNETTIIPGIPMDYLDEFK
jgi:uncharacterized protein YihD (DUF1040 family)